METCGHTVVSKVIHREHDSSLEVIVNSTLFAIVSVEDLFIQELDIAAFGDVLVNSGEEPESVICTVGGMPCLLGICGVGVILIRVIFLTCLVVILDQRKTCAVCYLCGEHELDLLLSHFGSKVNDTLDILNGISVAVAVSQTAVLEGSSSGPDEGDEAVICVPYIYHVVEVSIGSIYTEVSKLGVPELLELSDLSLNNAVLLVLGDDLSSNCLRSLTENVDDLLGLAGLENDIALESAAGVGVVVKVALETLFNALGVSITSVSAYEGISVAAVSGNFCLSNAEETLIVGVLEDLVLLLENEILLEVGASDEQGVLKVYLILLIVVVVNELAVAGYGKLSGFGVVVGDLGSPHLVQSISGNIVCSLSLDVLVLGGDNGVSSTVTAFALVFVKRLTYGRPGSRPVVACFSVLQVDVSAGLVNCNRVEAVTDDSSVCAGLYEAVAACIVGNDSAVLRVAEVVGPGSGSIGACDYVFLVFKIEMTVIHLV